MPDSLAAAEDAPSPLAVRYQPLVTVWLAVAAGIMADRLLAAPLVVWLVLGGAAWGVWLLLWQRTWHRAAGFALLVAVAAFLAAWHHIQWQLFPERDAVRFAGPAPRPVCVEVVALESPRYVPPPLFTPLRAYQPEAQSRLRVQLHSIRDDATFVPLAGITELSVSGPLAGIQPGDSLRVMGRLSWPSEANNPGQFNYAEYLRAQRQLVRLTANYPACVEPLASGSSAWSVATLVAWPLRQIDRLRAGGAHLLQDQLPAQQAELAAALLLGLREQTRGERIAPFMQTGTVHILAISGMHVGIVAGLLYLLLRIGWVSRRLGLVIVALTVILYALLTDANPPVVRATVLVLAGCLAALCGRRVFSLNALALAAIVVLLMNPADLFRTGPQLSFLATGTLISASGWFTRTRRSQDPLDRLLAASRSLPQRGARFLGHWAWQLTLLGGCVWLVTAPLVMQQFHLVTPVALILNTLVWVPVTVALTSGLLMLIVGEILAPLAVPLAWLTTQSLAVLEWLATTGQSLPGGHFWVPGPPTWWNIGFYGLLLTWVLLPRFRLPRRWTIALLSGWIACGLGITTLLPLAAVQRSPWLASQDGSLRCTFASVGHGCSVIVRLPDGKTLLYDAGNLGDPRYGAEAIANCLWTAGITHLDAVILSHADLDHYNAVPDLLQRFSVGVVYTSTVMFDEPTPALDYVHHAIQDRGVRIEHLQAGDQLSGPGYQLRVLHPTRQTAIDSDNANSLVIAIEHAGRTVLLTGDLEGTGLADVMAETPLDCDVLLAPHHGSSRSDPPGFAAWSTPEWVIVSGGSQSAQSSLTADHYTRAGAVVLNTEEVGAITFTLSAAQITAATWRTPQARSPGNY